MKFYKQGQFNPLKFLEVISEDLTIYENTRALEIKEDLVVTDKGMVAAKAIVVATHYPIMNTPGYYFYENASRKVLCYSFRECSRCKWYVYWY